MKTIKYDKHSKDFAAYLDDILIGFFGSYYAAEIALDAHVYESLKGAN